MLGLEILATRYTAWQAYRHTVKELSRLSERHLADIGIDRPDIPSVARRSAAAHLVPAAALAAGGDASATAQLGQPA